MLEINGLERRERKIKKKKGKQFQQTILCLHVVEKERTYLKKNGTAVSKINSTFLKV